MSDTAAFLTVMAVAVIVFVLAWHDADGGGDA